MRVFLIGLFLALSSSPLVAAEITGDYVRAITHTIRVPAGGSLEEGLALANEWRVKVLDQNPYMKSISYLGRAVSETEYKLLVLYEYPTSAVAAKAVPEIGTIMATAWGNDEGTQDFLVKLRRYIDPTENVSHPYKTIVRP